ncbi:MAG: methyltransferase family protein [Candidatus Hodarchaeota archaeon]
MNTKQMARWGIGPKFTIISFIYTAIVFAIQNTFLSEFRFVIYSKFINQILGIVLILIGFIIFLIPAFTIDKYFYEGKLCTKGIYAYLRHPIYASWISFIVPGFVILRGSTLGVTIPIFMYVIFRALIPVEEKYLIDKFGDEYVEYQSRVWAVFPKLWGK